MFKFLKEKLKNSISKISKKIDEEGKEDIIEEEKEIKEEVKEEKLIEEKEEPRKKETKEEIKTKKPEKKGFFAKIKDKFAKKEEIDERGFEEVSFKSDIKKAEQEKKIKKEEEVLGKKEEDIKKKVEEKETPSIQQLTERKEQEEIIKEKEKKKGIIGKIKEKIVTKKINENQFEDLFWDLESSLLENNVAVEVIDKIKDDLKLNLVEKPIKRSQIKEIIETILKKSIEDLFNVDRINLIEKVKQKKPYVICFIGINGSGKTTTIAKIAKLLQNSKLKCIFAASDTFRAASIEQLQKHADNLNIRLIKHDYGSDPAAVAFDAIKHANSKNIDCVLIDTAGRMHSNQNLMDELKKVVKVAKPDLTLFVGESITGNDCVEQIKKFSEGIDIDGIILTKSDVDEKGGAAISVSYVTKKPIMYIGVGQEYSDLKEFDPNTIIDSLGLAV